MTIYDTDPGHVLIWIRRTMVFASMLDPIFFLFIQNFPYSRLVIKKKYVALTILAMLVSMLFALSPWMFTKVSINMGNIDARPGPAMGYFIIVFTFFLIASIITFRKKIASADNIEKMQLKLVIIGLIISFSLIIFANLIVTLIFKISSLVILSNVAPIVFTGMMAYAIIQHRFLDIRLTLEMLVDLFFKSIICFGVFIIPTTLYFVFCQKSPSFLIFILLSYIASLGVLLINERIDVSIKSLVNMIFYGKNLAHEKTLKKMHDELMITLDIQQIQNKVEKTLKDVLNTTTFSLVLDANHEGGAIVRHVKQNTSILVFDELRKTLHEMSEATSKRNILNDTITEMENRKIAIYAPILRKNGNFDALLIGSKKNGGIFTVQDINIVEALRFQLSNVLENVFLYEKEKNFNEHLKSEVEKATRELKHAYGQLKTVDQMKDYIIDISSHELRTPATVIKSYLWLVLNRKKGEINEKQRGALDIAYQANEKLIQLITDMLDVSKIESKKVELNLEEFDIFKIVQELVKELSVKAKEENIYLKIEPSAETQYFIHADKEKTEEVIMNLLSNAIKYTKKGGVMVSLDQDSDYVNVHVRDTGVGIRKDDLSKLFTKFYRTEQTLVEIPTAGGTGLGLFITKSLVQMMGGAVWVESEPGKGSTFSFKLPKQGVNNED